MSKLVNQSRLQKFAEGFWEKVKGRYDKAFKEATISASDSPDKKITLTRVNDQTEEVSLADYARLQDRNKFKQDVSVDNVAIESNAYVNNVYSNNSINRCLGFRSLTSKNFVDGYISTLRVLVDSDLANDTVTSWKLWAIKKDNTNRTGDTVKKAYGTLSKNVKEVTINGTTHKAIDFEINEEFADEVYFIIKSNGNRFRIAYPNDPYKDDVVNLSNPPSDTVDTVVDWRTNADRTNTAIMYLYGRESIGSLSAKLDKVNSDSSIYVKHTDCVTTGGTAGAAGKVVKLGADGKLHDSLMPKIALNEYYEVREFTHTALGGITYENGDVVVVNNTGNPNNGKRYLCIKKDKNPDDLTEGFVELNAKDGVVTSVNTLRGDINLALAAEVEKIKLNITSGSSVKSLELPVITDTEIDAIINRLS